MITYDLSDFGQRELHEVEKLLKAKRINGLPEDFYDDDVKPCFNTHSGLVFLTNSNYDVCMVDHDGHLYSFYTTPHDGHEGCIEDLILQSPDYYHPDDQEYIKQILDQNSEIERPLCWSEFYLDLCDNSFIENTVDDNQIIIRGDTIPDVDFEILKDARELHNVEIAIKANLSFIIIEVTL